MVSGVGLPIYVVRAAIPRINLKLVKKGHNFMFNYTFVCYPHQGSDMLAGSTIHDFSVGIGDGECSVIKRTENSLECLLPKHSPFQKTGGDVKNGALQVVVSAIFMSHITYSRM